MKKTTALLPFATLVALLAGMPSAQAWERSQSTTITGERGTWSRQTEETRERGYVKRSRTTKTPKGQRSEVTERRVDKEAGSLTREHSVTRMDGTQVQDERTLQRTDDGWNAKREHTGGAGNTVARETDIARTEMGGTATATKTLTGAGGATASVEKTVHVEDGKVVKSKTVSTTSEQGSRSIQGGSYSTAEGQEGRFAQSERQNADGSTRSVQGIQGEDGRYVVKEVNTSPTGGTSKTLHTQKGSIEVTRP